MSATSIVTLGAPDFSSTVNTGRQLFINRPILLRAFCGVESKCPRTAPAKTRTKSPKQFVGNISKYIQTEFLLSRRLKECWISPVFPIFLGATSVRFLPLLKASTILDVSNSLSQKYSGPTYPEIRKGLVGLKFCPIFINFT